MKLREPPFLIFSLLLIGLITSASFTTQPSVSVHVHSFALGDPWSTLWIRSQEDHFSAIAFTTGAVFVAGYTLNLNDIVVEDILLVKYTTEGEHLWNQTWTTPYDEAAFALTTSADALYLAGKTTTGPYGTNGLLVKLDFDGNQLWNVSFGNFPEEWFTSVAVGVDGVYVGGTVQRSAEDDADALIVKFDFDGTVLWSETWDGDEIDYGYGVAAGVDGAYLVGKFGLIWNGLETDAFLTKFSLTGIQIWNSTWGALMKDSARAIAVYNESVYVTGFTQSLAPSHAGELYLRKYNSTGTLLWEDFSDSGMLQEGIGVFATENNVFVGSQYEDPVAGYRVSLLNYNTTGVLNWETPWGGAGNCQPFGFTSGVNSHYISGTTSEWLTDSTNGFLVKMSFDGETAPGPIELLEPNILNPYGTLILSWTQAFDADGAIDGYELQMDTTPLFDIPDRTWNVNATSLLLSNHPVGTYYFRVRARDNTNLFGSWSNILSVTIALIPPTLFNPWLAPMVLLMGALILIALILCVFIRRWRIQ